MTWPDIVVGVVATLFLGAGLLPPYFELWKRDGRVIGFSELFLLFRYLKLILILIDWVFLSIDTLGGLFSLFALGTINPSPRTFNKMLMWIQRLKAHLISWEGLCISWCKFSPNLFLR